MLITSMNDESIQFLIDLKPTIEKIWEETVRPKITSDLSRRTNRQRIGTVIDNSYLTEDLNDQIDDLVATHGYKVVIEILNSVVKLK